VLNLQYHTLELTAATSKRSSTPDPHQPPNTHSPSTPQPMHTLTLPCTRRPRETHRLCTRRLSSIRCRNTDAFFTCDKPHSTQHTPVLTRLHDSLEALVRGAWFVQTIRWALSTAGWGLVLRCEALVFVILECGDLAAAKDGFEREADEELGYG